MENKPIETQDASEVFEPKEHCPEYWPEKVFGKSTCGVTQAPPGVAYNPVPEKTQPYLKKIDNPGY